MYLALKTMHSCVERGVYRVPIIHLRTQLSLDDGGEMTSIRSKSTHAWPHNRIDQLGEVTRAAMTLGDRRRGNPFEPLNLTPEQQACQEGVLWTEKERHTPFKVAKSTPLN